MPIGFNLRIMPGLRISASTRGIRAGFGPRIARMNVGSGGLGVSTGVGPFYASTGVGRRRSHGSTLQRSLKAYERELRKAQREQEIALVAQLEQQLVSVHLEEFLLAQPQRAPAPTPVDRSEMLKDFRKQALQDISWFNRSERRTAKHEASQQAERAIQAEERRRAEAWVEEQARLDSEWQRLTNNDPPTVLAALQRCAV